MNSKVTESNHKLAIIKIEKSNIPQFSDAFSKDEGEALEAIARRILDIGFVKKAGLRIEDCRYIARQFYDLALPNAIINNQVARVAEKLGTTEQKVAEQIVRAFEYINHKAKEVPEIIHQLEDNPNMRVDYSGILCRDCDLAIKIILDLQSKEE
jgi:hypothetical protein